MVASALLLTSCGAGRYLKEGEHVLYQNQIDVAMQDGGAVPAEVKEALQGNKNYLLQKPNSKLLGRNWLRVGLSTYCMASPKDSSFFGNYLRRIGEAPVVYDEMRAQRTARQLTQLMQIKGCFGSTVSFDTLKMDHTDISIGYHIRATHRRKIDEVYYRCEKPEVLTLIKRSNSEALLRAGDYYDQEKISAERSRIVATLREAGYYTAAAELVTFVVDTTYDPLSLSIDVVIDSRNLRVYHINNIFIYPNSTAGLRSGESAFDTLIYTYPTTNRRIDYQFIYDKPMSLHPSTISRAMMLFPGMVFRPRFVSSTYNSLLNLRNFKYINIEFSQSPASSDSLPLVDAHVRLINASPKRISFSIELTNASPLGVQDSVNFVSSGNLGVETSVEYRNNNLLGGAELLKLKGSLLIELPKLIFKDGGNAFHDIFNAFEAGLDASLDVPAFLLPFTSNLVWQRVKPHTLLSAGGSYQYHSYYERILANTSFGYSWYSNRNRHQHQLLPIEITYVRVMNLDDAFAQRLGNDIRLKYQYSSHFVNDARYDYSFSNQQIGTRTDFTHAHLSVETAGNLLSAISRLAGSPTDSSGVREIFGVPFAQYLRLSGDMTHYFYLFRHSTLVARIMLGAGLSYGNSQSMPYEKSFFGGGPTTLRAWPLRHLGPGSYQGNPDFQYEERVGDLQLVINLEQRFPIIGTLEGAAFFDIGNVWMLRPTDQYPDGEINFSRFFRDLAVGFGLGLRLNISVATIRADFSLPVYDPGYADDLAFRPPHWGFKQIVTSFGIGYPF